MMRILLFLATNFAVMLVLGIILNVTGIAAVSYTHLIGSNLSVPCIFK